MSFDWSINLGSILSLLLGALITSMLRTVRQVRDELRALNGRMIAVETWRVGHEELVDERQADNVRRFVEIQAKLDLLRADITAALIAVHRG